MCKGGKEFLQILLAEAEAGILNRITNGNIIQVDILDLHAHLNGTMHGESNC